MGAGPGEFKATISAEVDSFDSLWVVDPNHRRVSIFAPGSRAHVRDVRVEAKIGVSGGDWLLLDRESTSGESALWARRTSSRSGPTRAPWFGR